MQLFPTYKGEDTDSECDEDEDELDGSPLIDFSEESCADDTVDSDTSERIGTIGRDFAVVLDEERHFLRRQRLRRLEWACPSDATADVRFSLALSGGGVRAAAFAGGVIWRLAEDGCLKNIDYVSCVSGGSYASSALATHIADAKAPPARGNVDKWYLGVVARMLCRMQRNTPYLSRDLGKDPLAGPEDGSGCLPRVFDIPIILGVFVLMTVLPIAHFFFMAMIPLTEFIAIIYGPAMRAQFCIPDGAIEVMLPFRLPARKAPLVLHNGHRVVMVAIFALFLLWVVERTLLSSMSRGPGGESTSRKHRCRNKGWLWVRSSLAALTRLMLAFSLLVVLINGPTVWRVLRFMIAENGDQLRECLCRQHLLKYNTSNAGVCMQEFEYNGWVEAYGGKAGYEWNLTTTADCGSRKTVIGGHPMAQLLKYTDPLTQPVLPMVLYMLLGMLLVGLLFMPFSPNLLIFFLKHVGPLCMFLIQFFMVQWRVFSPITNEGLFFGSKIQLFGLASWSGIVQGALCLSMLALMVQHYERSILHLFYSRSLQRAFFARGDGWTWGDIRKNAFCPYFVFGATVNEFMRPGDSVPYSDFMLSAWYTGGERTGYARTPADRSLARCSALSGGAVDGVALVKFDSPSVRFWLELFGIYMGDSLVFDRSVGKSQCLGSIPVLLCWEVIYALMLVGLLLLDVDSTWCDAAMNAIELSFLIAVILIVSSFFGFVPACSRLLRSEQIRQIHQLTRFYHRSEDPPSFLHVSDGGLLDNTGIVSLLRRRCERIVAVYSGNDSKGEFKCFRKVMQAMVSEKIGSLYDLDDPRRDVRETIYEFAKNPAKTYLHLGIKYGWWTAEGTGDLFFVAIRMPHCAAGATRPRPVRSLLTEEEIMGRESAGEAYGLEGMDEVSLGGCCCDCCHRHGCNFGKKFPRPETMNQWITPLVFSSLIRLGHEVSADAVHAATTHAAPGAAAAGSAFANAATPAVPPAVAAQRPPVQMAWPGTGAPDLDAAGNVRRSRRSSWGHAT